MKIKLSKRAQNITPSTTLTINAKIKKMRAEGFDVISFGAGEPDFDTPNYIKKKAVKAINQGFTKYTPVSGIIELKKVICKKFEKDNHLLYKTGNIIVSTGAKQVLYNIIQVLIDSQDEVIIPTPFWVSYKEMVKLAEGKIKYVSLKELSTNPGILEKVITRKTKLLILNSPNNPTGVVFSKKTLRKIAQICSDYNIFVISDEIYEKLIYEKKHYSVASFGKKIKDLTIVVNGVSKTYAMTGWRLGYGAGPKEIIESAISLQGHSTSNANSIAQKAALEALTKKTDSVKMMRKEYAKRRNYILERIRKIPRLVVDTPDGSFYIWVKINNLFNKKINSSTKFCQELLEREKVGVVPGVSFGDDNYIRMSYATNMEKIEKGLNRLERFVKKLIV